MSVTVRKIGEETIVNGRPFCNFTLRIVGNALDSSTGSDSPTARNTVGFIFEVKAKPNVFTDGCVARRRRCVVLKLSDFNTQKSLMDALWKQLPDSGKMQVFSYVKGKDSKHLRDFLWSEYTRRCEHLPDQPRIGYITKNLGYQSIPTSTNYWYLGKGLHIENNTVQDTDAIQVFEERDLSKFATTIRDGLVTVPLFLKMAMIRFMDLTTCFGVNQQSFIMALAFVASKIVRANEWTEAWRETNIGIIYSPYHNIKCGKSLALRTLLHLQGGTSVHPLFIGTQSLTGASRRAMLESLSSTTLVLLMDNLQLTKNVLDFFIQLQSGLTPGSLASGVYSLRASLLCAASNSIESSRLDTKVFRFKFVPDENHSNVNEFEMETFARDFKGLIVAWGMRVRTLWPEVAERANAIKTIFLNALQSSVPEQDQLGDAVAKLVLVHTMIHATVEQRPRIAEVLQTFVASAKSVSVLQRLQRSVIQKLTNDDEEGPAALTWINPSGTVATKTSGEGRVPSTGFRKVVFQDLEVTWEEVVDVITKTAVNPTSRSIAFAKVPTATIADLRSKRNYDLITTGQGIKIPNRLFDPLFLVWINYFARVTRERPEDRYDPREAIILSADAQAELENLEKEVIDLVAGLFSIRNLFHVRPDTNETATESPTTGTKRRIENENPTAKRRSRGYHANQHRLAHPDSRSSESSDADLSACEDVDESSDADLSASEDVDESSYVSPSTSEVIAATDEFEIFRTI